MIRTYVLIVTQPGATRRVLRALEDAPYILEAHEVMGPYDIVAVLEVEQLNEIPPVLHGHIRCLDGVMSTTSLVALPEADQPPLPGPSEGGSP